MAQCGNPVSFEVTKSSIEGKMTLKFSEKDAERLEQCFFDVDKNNVGIDGTR